MEKENQKPDGAAASDAPDGDVAASEPPANDAPATVALVTGDNGSRTFGRIFARMLGKLAFRRRMNPDAKNQKPSNPSATDSPAAVALVALAKESWKFGQVFGRVLAKLDAGQQQRYVSRLRWLHKTIDGALGDVGMKIVDLKGSRFEAGTAATAVNSDEFDSNDYLLVDQMLEPIIMGPDGVVSTGTVILRREEE